MKVLNIIITWSSPLVITLISNISFVILPKNEFVFSMKNVEISSMDFDTPKLLITKINF